MALKSTLVAVEYNLKYGDILTAQEKLGTVNVNDLKSFEERIRFHLYQAQLLNKREAYQESIAYLKKRVENDIKDASNYLQIEYKLCKSYANLQLDNIVESQECITQLETFLKNNRELLRSDEEIYL